MGAATKNSVGPVNKIGFHVPALVSNLVGCNAGKERLLSFISFLQAEKITTAIIIVYIIFFIVKIDLNDYFFFTTATQSLRVSQRKP